jgi:signal transduction histidine kinase/ActR/RegA family two-component response regulator
MPHVDPALFDVEAWTAALEKYGRVTELSVTLHGADAQMICGPVHSTGLFELFAETRYESELWSDCVRRCLRQGEPRSAVIVAAPMGLAVGGIALVLDGTVVGAAVTGYHLLEFPQAIAVERLAREAGVMIERVWEVVRRRPPVSRRHFIVQVELLQVLGDTLLKETFRARQHRELSARLQAADTAKDQFLAMVSHELRGPLNTVLGWVRLLRTERFGETTRERALETIERNALIQIRLIEDLLAISGLMTGGLHIERESVALEPIVQAEVKRISPGAQSKRIRIDVRLGEIAGRVAGDSAQLQRIVGHLLSNAVKFTPPAGAVSVRLVGTEREAELSVTDSGEGIKPEFLPHIFEPFRQQDSSAARAHGGFGLGLTIARHLIALHGGSIRAESPGPGRGSTFIVNFPLTLGIQNASTRERRPTDRGLQPAAPRLVAVEHPLVLVVEDDADARELMQTVLERAGFTFAAVASAGEALAVIDEVRPSVLVSDINLPGENGYSLIRKIRRSEFDQGRHLPAIAVTAAATPADRNRALSAGYQLYLARPVDGAELVRAIQSLVEPAPRLVSSPPRQGSTVE